MVAVSGQTLCGCSVQVRKGHEGPVEPAAIEGQVGAAARQARSDGKPADGQGPSGPITSDDVRSRVPVRPRATADGRAHGRTVRWTRASSEVPGRGSIGKEGSVMLTEGLSSSAYPSGERSARRPASAGRRAKGRTGVSESRLSPARNSGRHPGGTQSFSERRGLIGWVAGLGQLQASVPLRGPRLAASQRTVAEMRSAMDDVSARGASHARSGAKPLPVRVMDRANWAQVPRV